MDGGPGGKWARVSGCLDRWTLGVSGHEFLGALITLLPTPGLPTFCSPLVETGSDSVPSQEASPAEVTSGGVGTDSGPKLSAEQTCQPCPEREAGCSQVRPPRAAGNETLGHGPPEAHLGAPLTSASKENQAAPLWVRAAWRAGPREALGPEVLPPGI